MRTPRSRHLVQGFVLLLAIVAAHAAHAEEFPADAKVPTAAEITAGFQGRSFDFKAANGALVRTNYAKEGNSMTVVFGGGRSDNSTWTAEDGRICLEMRTIPSACNDLRIIGGDFHLRRSNGEIVRLEPR